MAMQLNNTFSYALEDACEYSINTVQDRIASLSSDLIVAGNSVTEAVNAIKDLQNAVRSIGYRVDYLESEQEEIKSRIEPITDDNTENPNQKGVLEIFGAKMEHIYKNILDLDFMPHNMFIN